MNRLDRDTTGLTILAKHMLSAAILSQDVANRAVHRTYLAIVEGTLTGSGTIDARSEGKVTLSLPAALIMNMENVP